MGYETEKITLSDNRRILGMLLTFIRLFGLASEDVRGAIWHILVRNA